jgi:hypothetical protein
MLVLLAIERLTWIINSELSLKTIILITCYRAMVALLSSSDICLLRNIIAHKLRQKVHQLTPSNLLLDFSPKPTEHMEIQIITNLQINTLLILLATEGITWNINFELSEKKFAS